MVLVALTAAACAGGGTPSATPGPASPAPIVGGITLTDLLGRQITVPSDPQRIVALSPTTVELVYAVGAKVVGRASSANYPPEAQSVPDVGSSYTPNIEAILSATPDLVIADSVIQPGLRDQLEAVGLTVVFAGAQRFDDVPAALRLVGLAVGHDSEGEAAARALEEKLKSLQDRILHTHPLILIVNGTPSDFFAATSDSYVGDLVAQLGGRNAADGEPTVGRFAGYAKLSTETILAADPDVILAISAVGEGDETISQRLAADPAWSGLTAVKQGKAHEIDPYLFLLAPGPRAGEALETLFDLLYPGAATG
jgi:iron complex transport system substrate-binding protein